MRSIVDKEIARPLAALQPVLSRAGEPSAESFFPSLSSRTADKLDAARARTAKSCNDLDADRAQMRPPTPTIRRGTSRSRRSPSEEWRNAREGSRSAASARRGVRAAVDATRAASCTLDPEDEDEPVEVAQSQQWSDKTQAEVYGDYYADRKWSRQWLLPGLRLRQQHADRPLGEEVPRQGVPADGRRQEEGARLDGGRGQGAEGLRRQHAGVHGVRDRPGDLRPRARRPRQHDVAAGERDRRHPLHVHLPGRDPVVRARRRVRLLPDLARQLHRLGRRVRGLRRQLHRAAHDHGRARRAGAERGGSGPTT